MFNPVTIDEVRDNFNLRSVVWYKGLPKTKAKLQEDLEASAMSVARWVTRHVIVVRNKERFELQQSTKQEQVQWCL
jgi:flagellar biosynthesis regulator FlaF